MQPDKNSRWKKFLSSSPSQPLWVLQKASQTFIKFNGPFCSGLIVPIQFSTYICKTQPAKMDWPAPWRARQSHAWFSSAIWLRHHQLIQKKQSQLMQKKLKSCTTSSRLAFTIPINWIVWETVVMQKAWGRERDCERYTALLLAGIYC